MIKIKAEDAWKSVKSVLPVTTKTAIWIIKLTVGVSFAIMLLKYTGLLTQISDLLSPIFKLFGLKGEAALVFVTGYFVNVYSAIAVAATLDMDVRSLTILSVMVLCAHSMIVETAVQKKTGTSAVRVIITRTLSAFLLGYVLNLILPLNTDMINTLSQSDQTLGFLPLFKDWLISTLKLVCKMTLLIYSLTIIQRLLTDWGIVDYLSKILKPLMTLFGLPPKTSFLWIIANIIGLAYGAAAMLEKTSKGELSKEDIDLLNTHIGISHSNFEDLFLLSSIGAIWWILLLSRWAMSIILVWGLRLEYYMKKKIKFAG